MKLTKSGLVLLAVGLLWPAPGRSQEQAVWSYQASARGWIGVEVSFRGQIVDGVETSSVVIKEVEDGSPAAQSGLRVGDVLTHIDGRPITQRYFLNRTSSLKPGDLLELLVDREDEVLEITVEAAERENAFVLHRPDIQRMAITLDTIRGAILRNLETLTISMNELHQEGNQGSVEIRLRELPSANAAFTEGTIFKLRESVDSTDQTWSAYVVDPGFTMSFRGLLVDSEEAMALNRERLRARNELNEVRRQERSRERQIRAAIQGNAESYLANDQRLRELKAREAELIATEEDLSRRLQEVQEQHIQREWAEVQARSSEAFAKAQADRVRLARQSSAEAIDRARRAEEELERSAAQWRAPIVVGQDYIWGADIKPLTPALAQHLAADEGVVVYQVPPGTPAAELGFQDLDVIVQVAGETVRSIGDLRATLRLYERPLRITVVRTGEAEPKEIVIRR